MHGANDDYWQRKLKIFATWKGEYIGTGGSEGRLDFPCMCVCVEGFNVHTFTWLLLA
jgi:hypothetical protein